MSTRISTSQIYSNATQHASDAREREVASSERASTQKQINRPSDDPAGWTQANMIREDLKTNDTIQKNISFVNRMLYVTDNLLAQLTESVQRAHEVSISAVSGASGQDARQIAAPETRALYDNVIRILNTRYAGRTLLGGFQTQSPAYSAEGAQLGDDGKMEIEVGNGVKMPVNLSASEIIHGKGLGADAVDLVETMRSLVTGMETDNVDLVQQALPKLMKAVDQMSLGRSVVAARMSQLDRAKEGGQSDEVTGKEALSRIEDVDAMKAISDLTRDQTVLRSALSTSQKILSDDPSAILFR